MADDTDDMITTERIGLTLWLVLTWQSEHPEPPTAADLAGKAGIEEQGMRRMLNKLSRVIPLYSDAGRWYIATKGPSRPAESIRVET